MYKLYGLSTSGNSYKVRLMLAHLGEAYQWEEIPSSLVMPRTPEFLAINPNGKVPVLILPGGQPLAESDGILYYLGHGTPYLPEGRLEQAQVVGYGCVLSSTATNPTWPFHACSSVFPMIPGMPICRSCTKKATLPWACWKSIYRSTILWWVRPTPSLTSPCSPIPMWPTKGATTWLLTRLSAVGSSVSHRKRAIFL